MELVTKSGGLDAARALARSEADAARKALLPPAGRQRGQGKPGADGRVRA